MDEEPLKVDAVLQNSNAREESREILEIRTVADLDFDETMQSKGHDANTSNQLSPILRLPAELTSSIFRETTDDVFDGERTAGVILEADGVHIF